MNKRSYVGLVLVFLVMVFTLTGCANSYQTELEELQQKYSQLEEDYAKLQEEYERIQNLPNIEVCLIDDRDKTIKLEIYPSLNESQKAYTEYFCAVGKSVHQYNITITCNNGEKVDDIYWICDDGKIESIMDNVSNIDNTYVIQVTTHIQYIHSLILKCNNNTVYTSFYGSYKLT